MLHGVFHQFFAVHDAHVKDGGLQLAVNRGCPFLADGGDAVFHAQDGAHSSAVTVSVKSGLHCHADVFAVVLFAVEQGSHNDQGVGDGVAPVMSRVLVVFFVNGGKACFLWCAVFVIFQKLHYFFVQSGLTGEERSPPRNCGRLPVLQCSKRF